MSKAEGGGLVLAAVMLGAGCAQDDTHLRRVTLWEGDAGCTACQARAITLWPGRPAGVTLREDSVYTAQLELDVSGDPDRCVFKFVSGTWELPSHTFLCDPEQPVMRRPLNTRRFSFPSGGDALWIRVDVLSRSEQKRIELLLDTHRYDVTWVR